MKVRVSVVANRQNHWYAECFDLMCETIEEAKTNSTYRMIMKKINQKFDNVDVKIDGR